MRLGKSKPSGSVVRNVFIARNHTKFSRFVCAGCNLKSDYNRLMTHVQLFITCLVDSFYPQTGEAIMDIFHRLGVTVEFAPDQTCCGQPNFNAGLRTEARQIAEHTIRVFEKTTGDIVMPSCSCAHMIKHNYLELFEDDPAWLPRAQALGKRVYEFTEYLVDCLSVTDVGAQWNGTLTYHP